MANDPMVHIIMPVKDSVETTEKAIRAIIASGHSVTVYDDYSSATTAERLDALQRELGCRVLHLNQLVDHPSPNYRWVLIDARKEALRQDRHLVIVESDVTIQAGTIERMTEAVQPQTGLVAAVTTDESGNINFPYDYARRWTEDQKTKKRLSFCCTLLSKTFLHAYDFAQLDETKNWYDVTISHTARQMGFDNILQVSNPVLHQPHSSRPWKRLKYTHPLLYYWRKWTQHLDKI